MKIALFALNSSYTHTNLAVRYLANALCKNGYEPSITEYNLKDKRARILHALIELHADIYAFSVYIWNIEEMLKYAQSIKQLLPDCQIVFGGPEVSFENSDFFAKYPFVDTIISGEGEDAIVEICKDPDKYKHKILVGQACGFEDAGILYDKYPPIGDILYYESSRGCPHNCSYCLSSLTKGVRAKSAEKTLSELSEFENLQSKPRIIKFIDRTFNFDLERAKKIWRALLDPKYTLNYHFEICADRLDDECFEIFKEMPKGKIQFEAGIQSTNPETLRAINRTTNNKKAIENLRLIKETGKIHVHADLIAGLPYEDMESFARSFDETFFCCDKLQLGFLKLLRGSEVRYNAQMHGYVFEQYPPYTVFKNNYISYEEINTLQNLSHVLERFYLSHGFNNYMKYAVNKAESPFRFFMSLTQSLNGPVDKMSQNDCRLALLEFSKSSGEYEKLKGLIALDALIYENKNPPEPLKACYEEINCKEYTHIINKTGKKVHTTNKNKLYIFNLYFDPDNIYLIDRTAHKMQKIPKDNFSLNN